MAGELTSISLAMGMGVVDGGVVPDLVPVDTFVIIGQSNADGRGLVSQLSASIASFFTAKKDNLRIYYKPTGRSNAKVPLSYFVDDGEWWWVGSGHDAANKMTHMTVNSTDVATASPTTYGIEVPFAYNYAQANPNRELRIIKCAIGGSTIETSWGITTPSADGIWVYFRDYVMLPAIAKMAAEGKRPNIIGIYWMQGESDASPTSQPPYAGRLTKLFERCRTELGLTVPKMVVGTLSNAGWVGNNSDEASWTALKGNQASVVAADSNAVLFRTDGSGNYPNYPLGTDNLHWPASSIDIMGADLYSILAPTAPLAVSDLGATAATGAVALSWSHKAGAANYLVEYKPRSSGVWQTWATVYRPGSTVTGLTDGTLYDFRVTSQNAQGSASATVSAQPPNQSTPINTAAPTISGSPAVGETLTLSDGTWSNSPSSYTRQWFADGVAISGATGTTYVLTTAELGKSITGVVTAHNAVGDVAATSAPVGPVTAADASVAKSFWLDASNPAGYAATGNVVTAINDLSGNGNNSASVANVATGTRTVNGLNAFDLNGTSSIISLAAALNSIAGAANSVLCVYASDVTSADRWVISGRVADAPRWGILHQPASTRIRALNNGASTYVSQTISVNTTQHLVGATYDGLASSTSLTTYVDGVAGTPGPGNNGAPSLTEITIGVLNAASPLGRFDGAICEICIYPNKLSTTALNNELARLKAKWGTP